jgi:hypothetical protein
MSRAFKEFVTGAFGLILAFLILTHGTGFAKSINAIGGSSSHVFRTLQGR